jgi:hypothetical protein
MIVKALVGKPRVFIAPEAKQIVYQMMQEDFLAVTKTNYMLDVKERVSKMFGFDLVVTVGDYEGFVSELVRVGLVTIEQSN